MHVVLDQRRVRYAVVSADEVRRFAPLPRTVYLVDLKDMDRDKKATFCANKFFAPKGLLCRRV